jgi:amphi-Trp domain-containing protein
MPRRVVSRGTDRIPPSAPDTRAAAPGPAPARVTATIPAKFRGRARRDAAAFYLSQLAKGVLAGEMAVGTGERPTALATSEFVILEIEVKQKKRANHVAIKLRWPKRPLIRVGARSSNGR